MDFHQLMQQASAKQNMVQKRHEMKKRVKEDEKRKEVEEQRQQQRKASRMLQDMKKASEKRQLEYRGVVQSQASGQHRSEPTRNDSKQTDSVLASKQSSASARGKQKISSTTKPSSSSSSSSSTSSSQKFSKPNPSSFTSSTLLKPSKAPSSSSSSKTAPIPKAPVDFKDLLKIAEKKSLQVAEKEKMKSVVRDAPPQRNDPGRTAASRGGSPSDRKPRAVGRGEREGSPLGKQLLEKSSSRARRKRTHGAMERREEEGRGRDGGLSQDRVDGTEREPLSVDRCTVGGNGRHTPQAGGAPIGRAKPGVGRGERGRGGLNGRGIGRGRGAVGGGGKSEGLPESALLMREKARRQLEASARTNNGSSSLHARPTAKTKSFYGGAHAQLSSEERPRFQTKPVSRPYQNSWVSEMSSYMQQVKDDEEGEEGWSEEEEEEMDDFVVDDVEEGDDYSSAIREIFGYDKRRFRDEEFDDRMMESSFAQQQFEEMRSSHIGWMEDQEDMKREAEQLARKRHKGMPLPSKKAGSKGKGLKQSKLSFR